MRTWLGDGVRLRLLLWLFLLSALALFAAPALADAASPLAGQWHMDDVGSADSGLSQDYLPDSALPAAPDHDRDLFPTDCSSGCLHVSAGGRFGNQLPESSTHTLQMPTALALQRVTLLAWVKKTEAGAPVQDQVIAAQGYDSSSCGALSYALLSGEDGGTDDVRFVIRQGGVRVSSPNSNPINDGQWHLVAGTFDGASVRLYVDGAQVGSGTPALGSIDYGTGGLFGADGFEGGAAGSEGGVACAGSDFTGGIDELRVYDRALTGTEIARLASATGSSPPALVPDQPPPTKPVAAFTAPQSPVKTFHQAFFDATQTKNATKLLWDINNDGHTDLVRPATEPLLIARLPEAGQYTMKLTAVDAAGDKSVTLRDYVVVGPKENPVLQKKLEPPTTFVTGSVRKAPRATGDDLRLACGATGQTVSFGVAQARGCFDEVTNLSKLPVAERAIFGAHYVSSTVSEIVARVCNLAAEGKLPQSQCDHAREIFGVDSLDAYVTNSNVKVNGVTLRPLPGAHVVVYPRGERVDCSACLATWGGFPVDGGPIDWNLELQRREGNIRHTGSTGFAKLLEFDASKIGDIAGFSPTGTVSLTLRRNGGEYWSEGNMNLSLPNKFTVLGGKPPTANVTLRGSNDANPVLDHLDLGVPEANLGGLRLTEMRFRYERLGHIDNDYNPGTSCERNQWKAQAKINLLSAEEGDPGDSLRLVPPPSQNGVGFCDGEFKHAGAQLTFGPADAPEIAPGVDLSQINFAMQLDPTLVRGGAGLTAAKITHVDGALLVAFAKPWEPYRLTPQDAGGEFATLAGKTFTSTTFAVGGDVFMDVPVLGSIRFGSGAMMYSYPNYLYAAGEVRVVVPGLALFGHLGAETDFRTSKFQASAGVKGCLGGVESDATCVGADGWLGTRGVAVCLAIAGLHPGGGYRWADHYLRIWPIDGCKPSRFWEEDIHKARLRRASKSSRADLSVELQLAKGEPHKDVELTGATGAPSVIVRTPDGRQLTVAGNRYVRGDRLAGVRVPAAHRTFIGFEGKTGNYTIESIAPPQGSARRAPKSAARAAKPIPIVNVRATRKGYDSNFRAHVTGHGRRRKLVFDARRPAGQFVTFLERGHNVFHIIGSSRGGRGRIRFTPAIGPGGRRTIYASATIDGTPIQRQRLASYVAPGIPRTGRPRHVRVRRKGKRLSVRWKPARGAVRYGVVLRLSDGSIRTFKVRARRHSLRISRVPLARSGRVDVSAVGVLGDWTRPKSARFKRLRKPFTVKQTRTHNERLTYLRTHHKHPRRPHR